jgi:hypothetical protein
MPQADRDGSGMKKKERKDLIKHLEQNLKEGAKGGKLPKDPWKQTKYLRWEIDCSVRR